MKISTKGRYGLRALVDLALYGSTGQPVLLADIAKRQNISEKYLEQIANRLHKAGLVKTVRGRKGGYLLNKAQNEIGLNEIIEILEGPLCIVDCVAEPHLCDQASICSARDVWKILSDTVSETLSRYTLADLVAMQNEKTSADAPMYYI